MLTRSCARRDLFTGKLLAVAAFALGLLALAGAGQPGRRALLIGAQPLVSLSGTMLSTGRALLLALVGVAAVRAPRCSPSRASRCCSRSPLAMGLSACWGRRWSTWPCSCWRWSGPVSWLHSLLVASAFDAWHGAVLLTHPLLRAADRGGGRQRDLDRGVPGRLLAAAAPARLRRRTVSRRPAGSSRCGSAVSSAAVIALFGPRRQLGAARRHRRTPAGEHDPDLQQPHAAPAA